jgi:predicted dehydrogenase
MRIAVVGLGFMGSTHLKALKNIPEAELAAVVSADPVKLAGDLTRIQGNLGGPGQKFDFTNVAKYTKLEELLADDGVDAVDICLPTHLHTETAIAALEAGKHVLVEKPMALDGDAASRMIAAVEKAGRILMTAQVLRFFPAYVALREQLQSGRLGQVRGAIFRRRCAAPFWSDTLKNKALSGGGVFDLLIHDVDFCIQVFGVPESVSAVGHEDLEGGIDWITGTLHYPHVGGVVISGGWHHPKSFPFSMEYTVVSDGGTIEYSSSHLDATLYGADGEKLALKLPARDGFEAELAYFVDCCRQGRQPEACPPAESAAAVRVTKLISEARTRKGEKIECRN